MPGLDATDYSASGRLRSRHTYIAWVVLLAGSGIPRAGAQPPPAPTRGFSGAGTPGAGVSGVGTPSAGFSGTCTPAAGFSGTGTPGAGFSGAGTPGAGVSGLGTPAAGLSGASTPGAGFSGAGTPGAGVGGAGTAGAGASGAAGAGAAGAGAACAGAGCVRLEFENRSGASCPDLTTLTRAVIARLGYDPFSSTASDVLLVSVQPERRGLRGEIRWAAGTRHGEARTIESKSGNCAELMEALALTMSIAIDPLKATDLHEPQPPADPAGPIPTSAPSAKPPVASSAPTAKPPVDAPPMAPLVPPEPTPAPTPTPMPTPTVTAPPEATPPQLPEPNHSSSSPSRLAVRPGLVLGAFGTAGFVPSPTLGASIGFELGLNQFALSIEARADFPSVFHVARAATSSEPAASGDIATSVAFGTAAACLHSGRVAGCAFGRVGRLQAAGKYFEANASGFSLIAGAGTRATYDLVQGKAVTLRALVDLDVLFTRNTLDVPRGTPVWTLDPPIAVTLGFVMLTSIP